MRNGWQMMLRVVIALLFVAVFAVIPAVTPSSCIIGKAEGRSARLDAAGEFAPHQAAAAVKPADAAEAPDGADAAAQATSPASPVAAAPSTDKGGEFKMPAAQPSGPAAARINPAYPGPTNLTGTYTPQSGGNIRNNLTWTKANPDTNVLNYRILRWNNTVHANMASIFNSLVTYEPSAAAAAQSFSTHTGQVMQPGLTITERQDIIDLIEVDLDTLFSIISTSSQSQVWALWDQLRALAFTDTVNKSKNDYQDNKITLERVNHYVVLADYTGGDTSPPTNSWGMFGYNLRSAAPATPIGFTATAYDPGVGLQWSPNQEMDLAGYNVYILQGSTQVKLNATLITRGTGYFDNTGLAGSTYYVEAVNANNVASTRASALSALAAATYYYADDPGWSTIAGTWVVENYISYGGYKLRVAQDAPSRTRITFSGRRVRVYCATYRTSGNVRIWVDGVDRGTYSLYSLDITWGVAVYTITGLAQGNHTLDMECVGTGGVPIPDSSPPEPAPVTKNFVNVQYLEAR